MADKRIDIDIRAADRTQAAFGSVKRGLNDLGGGVTTLQNAVRALTALAAGVQLTRMFSQSLEAASKAEQSSNRLNAVLRATGFSAGRTREELDAMADAMARATTFDDESVRDAQAELMKFGNIHTDTFDRAMKSAA